MPTPWSTIPVGVNKRGHSLANLTYTDASFIVAWQHR